MSRRRQDATTPNGNEGMDEPVRGEDERQLLASSPPRLLASPSPRPFRAADVLTGSIDRLRQPARTNGRNRKQISAQLEPAQVRLLGELQARLNETSLRRIEKSDLVGLGIELLAAVLDQIEDSSGDLAPAPDNLSDPAATGPRDIEELRAYLRTHVRAYAHRGSNGRR